MPDSYDPNELLDIAPGASEEEIRRAFRRKAKSVHPDVSDAPDAAEEFKRLKDAHDLLIERLHSPFAAPPEAGEDLYRPAPDVDEDKREQIINAFRRRREAEERRRSRRRSAVKGQARRAERQIDAFQEEMARRRAAFESRQREESQREQEERRRAEQEQQRAADEAEQRRVEELRRQEQEALERVKRQRETGERAKRTRPIDDGPLECAWKGCRVSDDLAEPVETALGPRRFCRSHYDEYVEFRRSKQRSAAFASPSHRPSDQG